MRLLAALWRRAPATLRKTIIAVLGGTVCALGLALIVLPGPFTLPLLIAGFAILGTEFAWAARALQRVRSGMERGAAISRAGVQRGATLARSAAGKVRRRSV